MLQLCYKFKELLFESSYYKLNIISKISQVKSYKEFKEIPKLVFLILLVDLINKYLCITLARLLIMKLNFTSKFYKL